MLPGEGDPADGELKAPAGPRRREEVSPRQQHRNSRNEIVSSLSAAQGEDRDKRETMLIPILDRELDAPDFLDNAAQRALMRAGMTVLEGNEARTLIGDRGSEHPNGVLELHHGKSLERWLRARQNGRGGCRHLPTMLEVFLHAGNSHMGLHEFGEPNTATDITHTTRSFDPEDPDAAMRALLVDMLIAIQHGRPLSVKGPGLPFPERRRQEATSVTWRSCQDGLVRGIHSDREKWRGDAPPENGRGAEPGPGRWETDLPDKLLTCLGDGDRLHSGATRNLHAHLVWERSAKGNHPAVTLDPSGTVAYYYEAPTRLLWLLFGLEQPEEYRGNSP